MKYRERRRPVDRKATVKAADSSHRVQLKDLSSGGVRLVCAEEAGWMAPGEKVSITCGPLSLKGRIAWRNGANHGVKFDKPLSPATLAELTGKRSRLGAGPESATMRGYASP